MKKVILTGDRPTGRLHVGHYVGSLSDTHITSYKGTDNSLSNAQSQAMKQIKKTSSEYDAKEIEELKKDTKTSPVYFRTAILSGKEMGMFDAYDALTVYFHNFKITPIYPMQQGTYKQEISDIQEDSPIYSSGFRNDTGVEVFGSQTLTNSTTYGAVNTVSGSKSYAYDLSCDMERKRVECAIMIKAALADTEGEEE